MGERMTRFLSKGAYSLPFNRILVYHSRANVFGSNMAMKRPRYVRGQRRTEVDWLCPLPSAALANAAAVWSFPRRRPKISLPAPRSGHDGRSDRSYERTGARWSSIAARRGARQSFAFWPHRPSKVAHEAVSLRAGTSFCYGRTPL